jgi:hypothetical protein
MLVNTSALVPVAPAPPAFVTFLPLTPLNPTPGFRMSLMTLGLSFTITPGLPGTPIAGKTLADFPPTPRAPQPWALGCVQNVITQSMDITWWDGSSEQTASQTWNTQMLDADLETPMQHLPFVRVDNAIPPNNAMPSLPAVIGLLYGLPAARTAGQPWSTPPGSGPAWNIATGATGPFIISVTDAPSISVFSFKGGGMVTGSPNPIVEVRRSITLQFWITAVPITGMRTGSTHNVLAFTNEITLAGKFNRRPVASASGPGFFNFSGPDFTNSAVQQTPNIGNTRPPTRRPVVTGPLSVEPVIDWLVKNGFSRRGL